MVVLTILVLVFSTHINKKGQLSFVYLYIKIETQHNFFFCFSVVNRIREKNTPNLMFDGLSNINKERPCVYGPN